MKNTKWEKVGEMGVDAGLCLVGDPCYVLGDDASHRVRSWDKFCDKLHEIEKDGVAVHDFGVTVGTGYGDGCYAVYVKRGHAGRVAAVKVVFMDEGLEGDELGD